MRCSRLRTIATSGLVSAIARSATTEAFHVLRIGGKVGRRVRLALDAADQAVPFEQVKYGNARGLAWLPGGCFRLYPGPGWSSWSSWRRSVASCSGDSPGRLLRSWLNSRWDMAVSCKKDY